MDAPERSMLLALVALGRASDRLVEMRDRRGEAARSSAARLYAARQELVEAAHEIAQGIEALDHEIEEMRATWQ